MRAILGLGSNIEPARNLASACKRLARDSHILGLSRPWQTPAVGSAGPDFLNCVAVVDTPLAPVATRRWLRAVEHDHGRMRGDDPNAARTLDIDILAIDSGSGWTFQVDVGQEPYHLLPLADLLPTLRLPDGRTAREHAQANPLPGASPRSDTGLGQPMERTPTLERRPAPT